MQPENASVALYDAPAQVRQTLAGLLAAGFDSRQVSLAAGSFRDELAAGLSGQGCFEIPGIGAVRIAGPLSDWVTAALRNAPMFGSLTAVGAGLHSVGISRASIERCEAALRDGRYLLLACGPAVEIRKVQGILKA